MKRHVIGIAALAVCLTAVTARAQETGLISRSRDLKLDFSDATAAIEKMARKFKPMTEKMDSSAQAVQTAIDAVKADPNTLNKAKFEKALASHMKPVMQNIDNVLASELEMQCALQDVSAEVKRVTMRIKQDHARNAVSVEELKKDLREKVKTMQKLAAEISAQGEKADRAKVMELKRLEQQVSLGEKSLKMREQVLVQLGSAMAALTKGAENLAVASDNSQVWFDNLAANRTAFRDLIRARKDLATLAGINSDGATKSLNAMLNQFNKAMQQIDGVGDLLSEMGGSVEALEVFNQDVTFEVSSVSGPGSVDVAKLADSILNRDYSYLDK